MRRFSASRNNCRGEVRFKHKPFELRYRKIRIILPNDLFADIEGCEGKIECEVKPGFVAGLLRLKSGELFGIAYAELDLEAGAVETDDLFRSHVGIGREVKKMPSVFNRTDDNTDVASQRP